MTLLYLDCQAGVAGDMLMGALVDAGADRSFIQTQLSVLRLDGWTLSFEETDRAGLRSLKAHVTVPSNESPRTYNEVHEIVADSALEPRVKETALRVFAVMARAEGRVHGTASEDAHFHEVGATDAIVDVVGTVAALHSLEVDRIVCSSVAVGSGRTGATAHGRLPVPAPATLEIFKEGAVPVLSGGEGELATPTGAALLVSLCDSFGAIPLMTPTAIGHGAGTRDREVPNIVRAVLGVEPKDEGGERVILDANIDDMAPELLPYVIERLLEAGADDAWLTPIVMKKGRPAVTVSALTSRVAEAAVARVFFKETTTLGLRTMPVSKQALERDWVLVDVEGHPVQVKIARCEGAVSNIAPEYEDAAAAARASGMALKDVYREASEAAQSQLRKPQP